MSEHTTDAEHVTTCLDCSVDAGKQWAIAHYVPTVGDVEPFIPEALKAAFWERYVGKYFDGTLKDKL